MIHQIEHRGGEPGRLGSLAALLLALILGVLGTTVLISILGAGAVVSASHRETVQSAATSPATSTIQITKTVQPTNPDTGGIVTICFTISGLEPQRVDVVLAQDVSTSMEQPAGEGVTQTRLEASQAAACAFVSALPSIDRAAVVSYSASACLAQPLTTSKSSITRTIYGLTVTDATNIGQGISVSHKELITSPRYLSYTSKMIILLSDGKANQPTEYPDGPAEYARARASAAASDTVKIYTIGFGSDADEELLQDIADLSGGRYFFAPDPDVLETIYLTIALELHNLVITDILPSGVEVNCSNWHDGWCVKGPDGVTTLTLPISNSLLVSDPVFVCFTATVNLDPDYVGPINLPGSGICYQDSGGQIECEDFDDPPDVVVGGRKIVGDVFYDENLNGKQDAGESGAPDVVLRTSTGLFTMTDVSGSYMLRTSTEPAISITIDIPPGYGATTSISKGIPAATGVYTVNFSIVELDKLMKLHLPIVNRDYPPSPVVSNGGFEDGWTGWRHGGELAQTITSMNPHSGAFSALLGDPTYDCEGNVPVGSAWVERTVLVPSYLVSPTLSFWYNIFTQDRNPYLVDDFDRFDVWVDNTLIFSDAKKTGSYGCELDPGEWDLHWQPGQVDVSAYSGRAITIRFENGSRPDGWFNTWTFIDDVRIEH